MCSANSRILIALKLKLHIRKAPANLGDHTLFLLQCGSLECHRQPDIRPGLIPGYRADQLLLDQILAKLLGIGKAWTAYQAARRSYIEEERSGWLFGSETDSSERGRQHI